MQINVAQLLKEGTGATRSYELEEGLALEDIGECQIRGVVELLRTKIGVLVRGTFATTCSLTCSRCLTTLEYPLHFSMTEEFLPTVDIKTGVVLDQSEDPCAFLVDDHHILDLGEAVRQYATLALPMKPLCKPDCAGLCPQCGANLNLRTCTCKPPYHGLQIPESGHS